MPDQRGGGGHRAAPGVREREKRERKAEERETALPYQGGVAGFRVFRGFRNFVIVMEGVKHS
jgi:hypothetical protein